MSLGLIGKKLGMTKVYTDKGEAVAVTVVDVSGNTILR
jgi:large subunit ribosomal protein L3